MISSLPICRTDGDRSQRGFTTLEIIVALALGGLLLALALASYQGAMRERRVVRVAEDLVGLLRFAQQSAVADSVEACRYEVVIVSAVSATARKVPRSPAGDCEVPVSVRVTDEFPLGVTVGAGTTTVRFSNAGRLVDGSNAPATDPVSIEVTSGDRVRHVWVEPTTGRVEVRSTP